jgi:hypothetical protein
VLDVYYGPQSGHDLLERTVWHAAQHLRQLYILADRIGVTPRRALPVDAFQGLPFPTPSGDRWRSNRSHHYRTAPAYRPRNLTVLRPD